MAIHILPPQLANQIAAGEVVDRPASIIKELVENSIDAGATRIDIDIEQGGCKLIRVRDNGCGINKEELALALARHATSKIQNFDDLTAIESLGFRGEALASISSISRLTLTSKTQEQQEAWQVYAEGRDMTPTVKPASHPIGSTVEVLDIFYNTPARRRFLKTEKTEFSHIDEVIRRIALAYPKVFFHLSHNGKSIRQYRAIESEEWLEERISKICGISFTQKGIRLSWQHDDLSIEGWIAGNSLQEPRHYFYVNGRVVKDRLLNHALKQAFLECRQSTIYSTDDSLSYVIYLSIDPKQVDVNVHPAKHEVRFHEARLVHDFVYEAMRMALSEQQQQQLQEKETLPQTPTNQFLQQNRQAAGDNIFQKSVNSFSKKESSNEQNLYHQRPDQPYSQTNHLYGKLISSSSNQLEEEKEQYVSTEQKAVIESLFPKRDRSLVQNNDLLFSNSETVATLGKVLTIINGKYLLLERKVNQYSLHILSIKMAKQQIFSTKMINNGQYSEQLLMPLSILLDKNEWQVFNQAQELLQSLNFQFETDKLTLKLMAVPKIMRNLMWQSLLIKMIKFIEIHLNEAALQERIIDWLFEQFWQESSSNAVNTLPDAIALMAELEQLDESECDFKTLIKPIDLSVIMSQFGFE